MKPAKAILIKKETDDKLVSVFEHVPLGKENLVDLDSRRMAKSFNVTKNIAWEREIINTVDNDRGWWPTEMLKIEGD